MADSDTKTSEVPDSSRKPSSKTLLHITGGNVNVIINHTKMPLSEFLDNPPKLKGPKKDRSVKITVEGDLHIDFD
jgi:hypothetical protein